jgi:hypothetical protein
VTQDLIPRFGSTKNPMSSLRGSQRTGSLSTLSLLKVMRTCPSWIQQHPHGVILRHLLNMVNSFLCSFTNYFDNQLLPNDLIIVRNHGADEEDEHDIKRVLERQGEAHIKVEIQSNSEFLFLTSSPTRNSTPPRIQIEVQDAHKI